MRCTVRKIPEEKYSYLLLLSYYKIELLPAEIKFITNNIQLIIFRVHFIILSPNVYC